MERIEILQHALNDINSILSVINDKKQIQEYESKQRILEIAILSIEYEKEEEKIKRGAI